MDAPGQNICTRWYGFQVYIFKIPQVMFPLAFNII